MGISLADLDRWDPGSIRAVATAATNRANHFRNVAHDQGAIIAKVMWEGASQDAAAARAQTISNSLLEHADDCDQAGRDVSSAASEVESIKAEWTHIQRMADRWGITIEVGTGSMGCFGSTDPEQQAEDERHLQIVHDAIVDLLRRANSTDQGKVSCTRICSFPVRTCGRLRLGGRPMTTTSEMAADSLRRRDLKIPA